MDRKGRGVGTDISDDIRNYPTRIESVKRLFRGWEMDTPLFLDRELTPLFRYRSVRHFFNVTPCIVTQFISDNCLRTHQYIPIRMDMLQLYVLHIHHIQCVSGKVATISRRENRRLNFAHKSGDRVNQRGGVNFQNARRFRKMGEIVKCRTDVVILKFKALPHFKHAMYTL